MNSVNEPTIVIEIGAEGGSIKVVKRTSTGGASEYSVQLRDQSLTFLSEDEAGGEIRRDSSWTESWQDVIKTLDRWPWPMLYPMFVDKDYRARVLSEVRQFRGRDGQPAGESAMERWIQVCTAAV